MLTAAGMTQSTDAWARDLGISTYTVEHAISVGLTMQDVFDLYTNNAVPPSTPPPRPPTIQVTPPGPVLVSPQGGLTFRALCGDCAEAARRYYDRRHHEHKVRQDRERAETEAMFGFINFEPTPQPTTDPSPPQGGPAANTRPD